MLSIINLIQTTFDYIKNVISNEDYKTTDKSYYNVDSILAPYEAPGTREHRDLVLRLRKAFDAGLDCQADADVKMYLTFVSRMPNGTEQGKYLALDLGGSNFRVLLVDLLGAGHISMKNSVFTLSDTEMQGTADGLFAYIASCLKQFVVEHGLDTYGEIPLGFTFSFPVSQSSLTNSHLVNWTKGFNISGMQDRNIVELLEEAIQKQKLNIRCVAILNDTVGCLMSAAFHDHNTKIGFILGTGTNACYLEKTKNIHRLSEQEKLACDQMLINTEWGAFGNDKSLDFLRTAEDIAIDLQSLHPGTQIYEKMISGMYLGETIRLLIIACIDSGDLFSFCHRPQFSTKNCFLTKFASEIESEDLHCAYENIKRLLVNNFNVDDASDEDCKLLKRICAAVTTRAAHLSACGLATLMNSIGGQVTVAVDGSLYRFHPHIHDRITAKLNQLIDPGVEYKLILSEDGSGKGAAIVAATTK